MSPTLLYLNNMSSEIQKIDKKSEVEKNFQNDRELPQNIEAEQNVLGSILYDNETFDKKYLFNWICSG